MEIATPLVMGYVRKMFVRQKMDSQSLARLPKDHSKMALRHPEAAGWCSNWRLCRKVAGGSPAS